MADDTPDTETVRFCYTQPPGGSEPIPEMEAEFDRWLARERAAAAAQELNALADDRDREMAEWAAQRRVAGVRCIRCDLRHEERQQYSCLIEGTAHQYAEDEIREAREVRVASSPASNRLRERAARIAGGDDRG